MSAKFANHAKELIKSDYFTPLVEKFLKLHEREKGTLLYDEENIKFFLEMALHCNVEIFEKFVPESEDDFNKIIKKLGKVAEKMRNLILSDPKTGRFSNLVVNFDNRMWTEFPYLAGEIKAPHQLLLYFADELVEMGKNHKSTKKKAVSSGTELAAITLQKKTTSADKARALLLALNFEARKFFGSPHHKEVCDLVQHFTGRIYDEKSASEITSKARLVR